MACARRTGSPVNA
jgi:hypothetical protein